MKLTDFLETLPEFAVDIKLNAKSLLTSSNLTENQKKMIFLGCAFASKNKHLAEITEKEVVDTLSETEVKACKIAGALMSMNNVYYRFTHLVENKDYSKMPAGLRMNGLTEAKHGIAKSDFELIAMAISAMNGCGMCMDSHERILINHDIKAGQIQDAVKIASVVNALSVLI